MKHYLGYVSCFLSPEWTRPSFSRRHPEEQRGSNCFGEEDARIELVRCVLGFLCSICIFYQVCSICIFYHVLLSKSFCCCPISGLNTFCVISLCRFLCPRFGRETTFDACTSTHLLNILCTHVSWVGVKPIKLNGSFSELFDLEPIWIVWLILGRWFVDNIGARESLSRDLRVRWIDLTRGGCSLKHEVLY